MKATGRVVATVPKKIYAALDLGTNNCRLLIVHPQGENFRVVDSFSRSVRLGEGLGETCHLSGAAIARAVEAVKVCVQKMRRAGVTRWRAIATAACRTAQNGAECIRRIEEETGIAFEIVSGQEEARLAVAGCAPLLDCASDGALVFDIGGGSTELVWVRLDRSKAPRIVSWASAPVGVVTLAERFGRSHLPSSAFSSMQEEALALFRAVAPPSAEITLGDTMHLLGTSGTVTTIAGIKLGLSRYDRTKVDGTWLDLPSALAVVERISGLDYAERVAQPCVGVDRADLVLSGCAIFSAIATLWPYARLRVADRGLREGILFALMKREQKRARHRRRRIRRRRALKGAAS